ncbi:MAG: hypothetical protein RR263_02965, partial [Oscillospiraceae bacterium]
MSMPVITPGTVTRPQAIADLIESIALQETGISHILNAEGEKIQAFVAMQGVTATQLLAVNQSVQNTIDAVTRLEMVMQSKLDLFQAE